MHAFKEEIQNAIYCLLWLQIDDNGEPLVRNCPLELQSGSFAALAFHDMAHLFAEFHSHL